MNNKNNNPSQSVNRLPFHNPLLRAAFNRTPATVYRTASQLLDYYDEFQDWLSTITDPREREVHIVAHYMAVMELAIEKVTDDVMENFKS